MKLPRLKTSVTVRLNSTPNQSQGKSSDLRNGRLLIGQNSVLDVKLKRAKAERNFMDVDSDYQADMGM